VHLVGILRAAKRHVEAVFRIFADWAPLLVVYLRQGLAAEFAALFNELDGIEALPAQRVRVLRRYRRPAGYALYAFWVNQLGYELKQIL
jgi:hypothetical protein